MIGQLERIIELKKLSNEVKLKDSKNIYAFTSGKGGTGKTFLSLNTAYLLAESGKKVLFVDLDFNMANANIFLNLYPRITVSDFFLDKSDLADARLNFKPNLDLILGDSGNFDYPRISTDHLDYFFNRLRRLGNEYDFIILDTGSGASEESLQVLHKSDYQVLVISPEPTSVMDAYVTVKLLSGSEAELNCKVIVNKASDAEEGITALYNLSAACKHFLGAEVESLGTVLYSSLVSESIKNQRLLAETPDNDLYGSLKELAGKFVECNQLANIHQPSFQSSK